MPRYGRGIVDAVDAEGIDGGLSPEARGACSWRRSCAASRRRAGARRGQQKLPQALPEDALARAVRKRLGPGAVEVAQRRNAVARVLLSGPVGNVDRAPLRAPFRPLEPNRTMNFPTLQPRQRQQHTVTPRLQHAVRLLQLSSLDFAQEVQDAMGRNPFLEVEDSPPDAGRVDVGGANGDGEPRGIDLEATAPITDAPYERENWQQSSSSVRQQSGDNDIGALDMIAADVGLRQHLHGQINVLPLDAARPRARLRDRRIARRRRLPAHRARRARRDQRHVARRSRTIEMQIALKRVQSLDPPGVGARNVARVPAAAAAGDRGRRGARARARDHHRPPRPPGPARRQRPGAPAQAHAGADRGGVRAHPPPEPASGLERRVDGDASSSRPT